MRIVTESFQAPRAISSTARRHGISRSLLMTWRRAFCREPISPQSEQSGLCAGRKALWHDGVGLSLYAKRLDRGRFVWPVTVSGVVGLSAAQMSYLLEAIDWRNPQHTWRPQSELRLRRIHYRLCLRYRNRRYQRLLRLSSWVHGWRCAERLALLC
nr:IS66 family insertion sequence element accessory protein TnpB [Bradyrhizobium sp. 197]